jgi:hypothetical protein
MLSYLFGYDYGDELIGNSFAFYTNNNTLFKVEINYCNKKIKSIVFSNQTYDLYLSLYSHPTWDSASKKLKYKLRCNELFYPHRKTIKSFSELLNSYHPEICRLENVSENEKLIFNIKGKQFIIKNEDMFLKIQ